MLVAGHRVMAGHVGVRDHEAPAVRGVHEPRRDQAVPEEGGVGARLGPGPHEPRALGCGRERHQGGKRGADRVAPAGRQDRVGHRGVERLAIAVKLRKARPVARERPSRATGAPPRVLGVDLELDHRVGAERLAHALGFHRAATQRQHAAAHALEQLQHYLLLARPERRFALAVEERRDRLAEPALELVVRVERADP